MYYNLLERVSLAMKEKGYCLPPEVQGVHHDDTGAVIAVVLYFIREEHYISKIKIICYLILLDRICRRLKEKGHIVRWDLNKTSIQKFINELIDFMKKQKLIRMNGNSTSQIVIYDNGVSIFIDNIILPNIPSNVLDWLNSILEVCKNKTGTEMSNIMLPKTTRKHLAVVKECLKRIDEHEADAKNQEEQ